MQGWKAFITTLRVFLSLGLFVFLANAAQCQELPKQQANTEPQLSTELQMLNQLPADVRAGMKPGIRYTVGAQTNAGWEKPLVSGNKNLGHFFWSPITSMVQASPSKPTSAQAMPAPTQAKPEYHYAKPVHAALPQRPPEPVHVVAKRTTTQATRATLNRSTADVSAKIAYRKPKSSEDCSGQLL